MHSGLEKEVDLMCNLSDYVEERGIEKGIQKGIKAGVQSVVLNLLRLGTLSDKEIMTAGNLSPEELARIKKNWTLQKMDK